VNDVTASISRASGRRAAVALFGLALALRLIHLGTQSLWVDEMLTLIVATPKPGYPLGQLLVHNIHGPLHTFVVAMMRLVSENDAWLRLPSALAGAGAVPLLYAWARRRFGHPTAVWAALLLAINPLHIHYSQELRNYAFLVFFVLAGCVLLDRLLAQWSRRGAAAFAGCAAAAILSNFSACFTFAVQTLVFVKGSGHRPRALARWAAITALVLVITSPWIYRVTTFVDFGKLVTPVGPGALEEAERLRGDTTFRFESVPYAFYAYSVGFALGPTLREMHGDVHAAVARHVVPIAWTALLFGTLAVAGCVGAARGSNGSGGAWRAVEPVLYIVVPLVATLLLNWQNAKAFNVRYILAGLPMYLTVLAVGIRAWGGRRARVAGVLVVTTCAAALFNYYTDSDRRKEDVRAAVRAVEARMQPGECIFAPTVWQIVAHYQTTGAPLHYIYRDPPGLMDRQLDTMVSSCSSFWYIRARPWVDDADGKVLSAIEARYTRDEAMDFPGVSVLHFVAKN
jgi:hypothetical protein